MAGFFGLFRNKTKYVDEPTDVNDDTQKSDAFYLSDDDAKSMGNPEYIRKSMKKKETKPSVNDSKSSIPKPSSVNTNRSVDTNMDVFRKMAKDIKK